MCGFRSENSKLFDFKYHTLYFILCQQVSVEPCTRGTQMKLPKSVETVNLSYVNIGVKISCLFWKQNDYKNLPLRYSLQESLDFTCLWSRKTPGKHFLCWRVLTLYFESYRGREPGCLWRRKPSCVFCIPVYSYNACIRNNL